MCHISMCRCIYACCMVTGPNKHSYGYMLVIMTLEGSEVYQYSGTTVYESAIVLTLAAFGRGRKCSGYF